VVTGLALSALAVGARATAKFVLAAGQSNRLPIRRN
jgi:hypothetical protein